MEDKKSNENLEFDKLKSQYYPLLKDFKIKEILGHGAYSIVLKVEFPNKHIAAIKVFKSILDIKDEQDKIKNINNELSIIKSIRNEYFVKTLAILKPKVDTKQYFGQIMEIALYKTFNNLIRILQFNYFKYKPTLDFESDKCFWLYDVSESMMKFFARQIIHAYEFMKINKLIHLDFKPENILIDQNFQIKVTDFSLTKKISTNDLKAGKIKLSYGTVGYMGKEYYTESKEVNIEDAYKVDYFGLGCILYLMIFREHLIKPSKKKYNLSEISEFIENGKKKLYECKRISKELKEFIANLIGDIKNRMNINQLLNNRWAFPKKSEYKFVNFNYNNNNNNINNSIIGIKTKNINNCNNCVNNLMNIELDDNNKFINKKESVYVFDEMKEQIKLEEMDSQDPIKLVLDLNVNDNINHMKKNPKFYQHRKKFKFINKSL